MLMRARWWSKINSRILQVLRKRSQKNHLLVHLAASNNWWWISLVIMKYNKWVKVISYTSKAASCFLTMKKAPDVASAKVQFKYDLGVPTCAKIKTSIFCSRVHFSVSHWMSISRKTEYYSSNHSYRSSSCNNRNRSNSCSNRSNHSCICSSHSNTVVAVFFRKFLVQTTLIIIITVMVVVLASNWTSGSNLSKILMTLNPLV